jgi:hypothetical protein
MSDVERIMTIAVVTCYKILKVGKDEENQEKACHDGQCSTEFRIGYFMVMSEVTVDYLLQGFMQNITGVISLRL